MTKKNKETKIITMSHQKGGVGKTVVSAILATELADRGYKTALIDTDPQGSLYLKRVEQMDTSKLSVENTPYPIFHFSEIPEIEKFINSSFTEYDYLIIDTKGEINDNNKTLLYNSDIILIPLTAGDSDWSSLQTYVKVLSDLFRKSSSNVKLFAFYNRVRKTNRWTDFQSAIPDYLKNFKITIPEMASFIPGKKQPLQLGARDEYETIDTLKAISKRKGITWKIRKETTNFVTAIINELK